MLEIALKREFGGKVYVRGPIAHRTKLSARTIANQARKRGRLARIVKVKAGYVVYQHAPTTTIKKVKSYQPRGRYKETSVDKRKKTVDFRLLQVSPNVIRWKGGETETVTARTLKKLQKAHTWATDF